MRRMKTWGLITLSGLLVGLFGCGGGAETKAPSGGGAKESKTSKPGDGGGKGGEAGKTSTSTGGAPAGWGTVAGQVTWKGAAPSLPALKVDKDQASCLKSGPVPNEEYVINPKNQGVQNVFVWLVDATEPKKLKAPPIHADLKEVPKTEAVIDQPACKFEPHAQGIRLGQTLVIKNSSDILHNSNWNGGEGEGANPSIPAGGKVEVKVKEASYTPFIVNCGVHPWMKGYFRVFDHPYFAVTDADGKFSIAKAPAGKYNIVMWHEAVGWVNGTRTGQPVEIKADGTTEASATMSQK